MNKQKTLEILKILIASCRKLELLNESLSAIGIDTDRSDMEYVKSQLMDCVSIMFGIGISDMAGDEIDTIMLNTELSDEQMFDKLIERFGVEKLEK